MPDINTLLGDSIQHKAIPAAHIHKPFAWVVRNRAERDAIDLTPDDRFKFLYQLDTMETFMVNEHMHWGSVVDSNSMNKFAVAMSIVFGGNNV